MPAAWEERDGIRHGGDMIGIYPRTKWMFIMVYSWENDSFFTKEWLHKSIVVEVISQLLEVLFP